MLKIGYRKAWIAAGVLGRRANREGRGYMRIPDRLEIASAYGVKEWPQIKPNHRDKLLATFRKAATK